jgi:hypothetical protein
VPGVVARENCLGAATAVAELLLLLLMMIRRVGCDLFVAGRQYW